MPNSYSIPEFGRPLACPTASVLVLEPHFLARRVVVACGAAPASRSSCEGTLVFVSKEHGGLMAPVASHHVRISERRVFSKELRRCFLFVFGEIITAEHSPRGISNHLSIHLL